MKGVSWLRNARAFLLLRSISYSAPPKPNRTVSSAGPPSRSSSSATVTLCAISNSRYCDWGACTIHGTCRHATGNVAASWAQTAGLRGVLGMPATPFPPIALESRYPNPRRDSVGDLAVPEPIKSRCVGCVRQMTERRSEQLVPREIEFAGSDGTRLAGTLTVPPGTAQFPVVVAVHAASGGTRDAPLHRHLASFLPSLGVATFIYDRRGEGASGGPQGASLAVLAGDARAAVSVIAPPPAVRSRR